MVEGQREERALRSHNPKAFFTCLDMCMMMVPLFFFFVFFLSLSLSNTGRRNWGKKWRISFCWFSLLFPLRRRASIIAHDPNCKLTDRPYMLIGIVFRPAETYFTQPKDIIQKSAASLFCFSFPTNERINNVTSWTWMMGDSDWLTDR